MATAQRLGLGLGLGIAILGLVLALYFPKEASPPQAVPATYTTTTTTPASQSSTPAIQDPPADLSLCNAQAHIDAALALQRSRPTEYLQRVRQVVASAKELGHCSLTALQQLYEAQADAESHMHLFRQAVASRLQQIAILDRRRQAADGDAKLQSERAIAAVQLAEDQLKAADYNQALATLDQAENLLSSQPPPEALSVVLQLRSRINECAGHHWQALDQLEAAMKLSRSSPTLSLVQQHADLAARVLFTQQELSAEQQQEVITKLTQDHSYLLSVGPFLRTDQLPGTFVKGLEGKPWHRVEDHAHVMAARDLLVAAAAGLREEYAQLKAQDLLEAETECIHDPHGGGWQRFEITAYWQPQTASHNCTAATPVACRLMADLRQAGLPVIRAGYSMIGPLAWLRPHFGMTNAQLKLHLGLIVPRKPETNEPCATLRVGEHRHAWVEDDVLFFDDSFYHEVHNECKEDRVVFQVVFSHYDLDKAESAGKEVLREWLPGSH